LVLLCTGHCYFGVVCPQHWPEQRAHIAVRSFEHHLGPGFRTTQQAAEPPQSNFLVQVDGPGLSAHSTAQRNGRRAELVSKLHCRAMQRPVQQASLRAAEQGESRTRAIRPQHWPEERAHIFVRCFEPLLGADFRTTHQAAEPAQSILFGPGRWTRAIRPQHWPGKKTKTFVLVSKPRCRAMHRPVLRASLRAPAQGESRTRPIRPQHWPGERAERFVKDWNCVAATCTGRSYGRVCERLHRASHGPGLSARSTGRENGRRDLSCTETALLRHAPPGPKGESASGSTGRVTDQG
jgi:hypothetical protein